MEAEGKRNGNRGEANYWVRGTKTDGSGLSSLISSSQRYLTFLCIISLCCHPTSLRDCRIKSITYRNEGQEGWRDWVTESETWQTSRVCGERIARLEISEKTTRSNYIFFPDAVFCWSIFGNILYVRWYYIHMQVELRWNKSSLHHCLVLTIHARAHLNHFKRMFSTCLCV